MKIFEISRVNIILHLVDLKASKPLVDFKESIDIKELNKYKQSWLVNRNT